MKKLLKKFVMKLGNFIGIHISVFKKKPKKNNWYQLIPIDATSEQLEEVKKNMRKASKKSRLKNTFFIILISLIMLTSVLLFYFLNI